MDEQANDDQKHNLESEASKFEFKLDIDYNSYKESKHQYSKQFRHELASVLNVAPNHIELNNHREGSWIFDAIINIIKPKRWLRFQNNQFSDKDAHDRFIELMRIQDQISVEYQNKWYNATIIDIKADVTTKQKKKHFQVRYNPKDNSNGTNPFWSNTEWFYSKDLVLQEDKRLRYPKKKYVYFKNANQGDVDTEGWKPPEIIYRPNVANIQINDHIFVNFDKYGWRRSKVVGKGTCLTVRNLMDGDDIKLGVTSKSDRIQFCDMRYITFPANRA